MHLLWVICFVSSASANFFPPWFWDTIYELCPLTQSPPPPVENVTQCGANESAVVNMPQCGENEYAVENMTTPQKTCANRLMTTEQEPCSPFTGCVCMDGYVRPNDNATGACIPEDECPDQCSSRCRPTCANPTVPPDCPEMPYDPNDPCQCAPGYVLCETSGQCIQIESCADNLGCDGDMNATISACPSMCPATCDSPSVDKQCCEECQLGCECKPGFILSMPDGNCIPPDQCPCQVL